MINPHSLTEDEAKIRLRQIALSNHSPKALLNQMFKLAEQLSAEENDAELQSVFHKKFDEALSIIGLDTHYTLGTMVNESIRPLVIEFSKQLVLEYNCTSMSERALAEVVVGAYARVLEFTGMMNKLTQLSRTNSEITQHYAVVSKELDRANRHFTTALSTLRQIKSPTLEVRINAKTAFVATQQQFNTNPTEATQKDQI